MVVLLVMDDWESLIASSSTGAGLGDANLAVGRGPEDDGPLSFFNIVCFGGGLEALLESFFLGGVA